MVDASFPQLGTPGHSLNAVQGGSRYGPQPVPPPASLDPIETSAQEDGFVLPDKLPPAVGFQEYLHGSWQGIRSKVYASMRRTGQTTARCRAFMECGSMPRLQFAGPSMMEATEWRCVCSRCHDRLCTPCAIARSWDIRLALHKELAGNAHKFITLTVLTRPEESLKSAITRLYAGFKALRRMPIWKNNVRGGAAFLEITRGSNEHKNKRAGCGRAAAAAHNPGPHVPHWHAHLHIIANANYMKQADLSIAWRSATLDSYIVWIEESKGDKSSTYVTKYITKALDGSFLRDTAVMDEFVMAIKGTRFITTFGSWYGKSTLKSLEDDPNYDPSLGEVGWSTAADLATAVAAAVDGDPLFLRAINATAYGRWLATRARAP